jgi:hypothetical protein
MGIHSSVVIASVSEVIAKLYIINKSETYYPLLLTLIGKLGAGIRRTHFSARFRDRVLLLTALVQGPACHLHGPGDQRGKENERERLRVAHER